MNKKIIMLIGVVLLVAGVAYASGVVLFGGNAYEDSNDGLVLDMDLTEANYVSATKTFADDSGEGNDGVSANAATFSPDKYGMSTGAMGFDGSGDYVDFETDESLNLTSNFTVSLWARRLGSPNADFPGLISNGIGDLTDTSNDVGQNGWALTWRDGAGNPYVSAYIGNGTGSRRTNNLFISDNNWHHFVLMKNGDNLSLYFEGVLNKSTSINNALNDFESIGISIGSYKTYSRFFNGSISQTQIWNRTLSATEVEALYESSKPKMSAGSINKGLVGHWMLDDEGYNSNTERITDKTPYENHGTNSGSILTTDRMGQSNRAMEFDGGEGGVDSISSSTTSGLSNIVNGSISLWVNSYNSPDYGGNNQEGKIKIGPNKPLIYGVNSFSVYWSGSSTEYLGSCGLSYGEWRHITLIWINAGSEASDGKLKYYREGILCKTVTGLNLSLNTVESFEMGSYGASPLNGSISDVRIYNRALSADEIDTLYNSYRPKAASGSLYKGLIFDMPLTSTWTKSETVGTEIMTDRTPYSNDGQNYGATVGSDYTSFDGVDNYVLIGDEQELNPTQITISAWFKLSSGSSFYNYITSNSRDCCGSYNGTGFKVSSDNYLYARIWNDSSATVSSNSALNIGQWYHAAFTYNGNLISLYIDGELNSTTASTLGIGSPASYPFAIGGMGMAPASYNINGSISGVKIYNRPLTAEEIKLLYDKGR